jgi:hypothetical protein
VYLHDYFGPNRTAKIASTNAADLMGDGTMWRKEPPLTGDESMVAEVRDIPFPKLLDPVDDLAPTTMITQVRVREGKVQVNGVSHDNGEIAGVTVNGQPVEIVSNVAGVVDWKITLEAAGNEKLVASAKDKAGNVERVGHQVALAGEMRVIVAK